jgi:hypothetical protein
MAGEEQRAAADDLDALVDRLAEQEPAVPRQDRGLIERLVAAVDPDFQGDSDAVEILEPFALRARAGRRGARARSPAEAALANLDSPQGFRVGRSGSCAGGCYDAPESRARLEADLAPST